MPTHAPIVAVLALSACSAGALAQASALLREGAPLAGSTISALNNTAVNAAGGYAVTVNTADGVSRIWGSLGAGAASVIRSEGFHDGVTQAAFEAFFGISHDHVLYSPTGNDGPTGVFDSVFLDDSIVMIEGTLHPTLPGQYWRFGSRPAITTSGHVWFVGGLTNTPGGATMNRGLFTGSDGGTVVLLGGRALPGFGGAALNTATAVDFDFRVSSSGNHYIAPIVLAAPTNSDAGVAIDGSAAVAAGGVSLREGVIIPPAAGGIGAEAFSAFDFMGITNDGHWMVTGDTNAATSADEFLMIDGVIVLRDGSPIGPDTIQGDIEAAYLNDNADYAVIWDLDANATEALIVNRQVVLREGDAVDWDNDGVVDPGVILTNFSGTSTLTMSDRVDGVVSLYFTADVTANGASLEGCFILRVQVAAPPPPCDCDWNHDRALNSQDFFDFLTAFFSNNADYNADGTTNSQDFFDFLACFFKGC
jgi:hypothetical protein